MKMFFKTYVSWIYLYQKMDSLLGWGVHKGMIQWDKYLNLTKRKRKSKAEKKVTTRCAIQGMALLPEQPELNISEEEKKAVTNLL